MRSGRAAALLPCVALIAALATGFGAAAREGRSGDEAAGSGPLLQVRLTTSDSLPAAAKASLTREVEDIWRRAGVRVQWPGLMADATAPDATLRVLVVRRESPANNREHQWPVGELLRDQNERSGAVLERLGFVREGYLRERWIVEGEVSDSALYGLLKKDWLT